MEEKQKPYIVRNSNGEEFLLPCYAEPFRVLMDDKETIRDVLNSLLQLDHDHEITDLEYQFEKPLDIFMPDNDPARLDAWVSTRDRRFINIEMQNRGHAFLFDRMQLYNAYLTLRGKHDFNKSEYFMRLSEKEQKYRFYELPETVSIWLCNFSVLSSKDIFKDTWAVYSENDVQKGGALPLLTKNRYIVVDLPNFMRIRNGVNSREDFWLQLISRGPLQVPATEDPLFAKALDRLRVSHVKPELLKSMEVNMFDHHEYDAIMAEAWLKGEAQGMEKGMEKGMAQGMAQGMEKGMAQGMAQGVIKGKTEGLTEGHSEAIDVLKDMNFPAEQIAEVQARLAAMAAK